MTQPNNIPSFQPRIIKKDDLYGDSGYTLRLIKPNTALSKKFILVAEETLRELKNSKSEIWRATQKYYLTYYAAYSILMKFD